MSPCGRSWSAAPSPSPSGSSPCTAPPATRPSPSRRPPRLRRDRPGAGRDRPAGATGAAEPRVAVPDARPADRHGLRRGLAGGPDAARAGRPRRLRRRRPLGVPPAGQGHPAAARQPAGGHRRPAGRRRARRPHRARAGHLRALLAGGVPAAGAGVAADRPRHRHPRRRAPGGRAGRGPAARPGAAAQRELGRRRRLVHRLPERAVHDRRRAAEARVALPPLPRLPRVAGHAGRPAHRRGAEQLRRPAGLAERRPLGLPAHGPRPRRLRHPGPVLRPPDDHAGRPRAARRPDRRRAASGRLPVHRRRLAAGHPPRGAAGRRRAAARPGGVGDPGGRGRLRRQHRPAAGGLAHAGADLGGRRPRPGARLMRIGLVCPYQWDVPGGVQYHVRDLAETLRGLGHHVEVLTPAEREESLTEPWLTWAGRTVPIPYNGSMSSVQFGPVSATRVRRWLRDGHFDVVHVHDPAAPSIGLSVCMLAEGPIVATFHAATVRSKWLSAWGPMVRPWLERISGRIAVSDFARRLQVEHLGGDAVIIPNGVHVDVFAEGPSLPGHTRGVDGPTIGFIGRYDEPRKGLPVLLEAMRTVVSEHPGARLLVAGRGDDAELRERIAPELRAHVALLGELTESDKAAFLRSVDVYCAPNLLGESFGVILIEALAAGAPIVASDLAAFARVLEDGTAGVLVRRGDAAALAQALCGLLADPARRAALSAHGQQVAAGYDWSVLVQRILAVYETVVVPGGAAVTAGNDEVPALPPIGEPARWWRARG